MIWPWRNTKLPRQLGNGFGRGKRWPLAQQARFCQLLADQLHSGFSLQQAVAFLNTVETRLPASLAGIAQQLAAGAAVVPCLEPYLEPNIYFQLQLTTTYGDLAVGLQRAATLLRLVATQRRKLRQLLAYPLGLLAGMGGLLIALQWGILPELRTVWAPTTATTGHGFQWGIVGLSLGGLVGGVICGRWWWQHPHLQRAAWLVRLPLFGPIFRSYYAYYLTENLGQLVASGLSVKQMLTVLDRLPAHALLAQLAQILGNQLNAGTLPLNWLRRQDFVPQQLVVLLQQGSTPAELARELQALSRIQYRELVRLSERCLAWVQPVLLTLVAGLIVGAYLKLLLPLYQNLQGVYQ